MGFAVSALAVSVAAQPAGADLKSSNWSGYVAMGFGSTPATASRAERPRGRCYRARVVGDPPRTLPSDLVSAFSESDDLLAIVVTG